MKKVLAQGTKYIFGAFAIAVIGLLMSLTYQAMQRIFPGNFGNQIWGLVLFDIAAISWALAFVFHSESVTQYAVSAIGFLVGFIGTLGMVAAEVVLGQDLMTANTQQIGQWIVYGFIGATALHAALIYAHHASTPDISEKINIGIARGEIVTAAITQATKSLEADKAQLAQSITQEIIDRVKRDLEIPIPAKDTVFDPSPRTFEQTAPALPHPIETPTKAGAPDNYGPLWKSSTDIAPTLAKYAWVCLNCEASHDSTVKNCSFCGTPRMNMSPVTAFPGASPTKQLAKITKDEPTSARLPFQPE